MEFFFLNINQRKKIREVYNERKRSGKYDHLFMKRMKKNCDKRNSRIPNQKKKKIIPINCKKSYFITCNIYKKFS